MIDDKKLNTENLVKKVNQKFSKKSFSKNSSELNSYEKFSVEIIVPAHNESDLLENNINQLHSYMQKFPFEWKIIIGENGSTDNTLDIAKDLSLKLNRVTYTTDNIGSRDKLLKKGWIKSNANIMIYMDADFSVNLTHIEDLINKIKSGFDIVVGSRMHKDSIVKRSKFRLFLSYIFNYILIPILLPTGVGDAGCGFKAIGPNVKKELPKLQDNNGFLDTELLGVLHHKNYKISEIPVEWIEKRDSAFGTMNLWTNIPNYMWNLLTTRKRINQGYYKISTQNQNNSTPIII